MAEPTIISAILEPIGLILSTLTTAVTTIVTRAFTSIHYSWWASRLVSLVALPLKLLLVPFKILFAILLTVLSPLVFVLSYALAVGAAVWRLFASLEPLYTFFGAAALVGIIAGVLLSITSRYITTHLGMHTDVYSDQEDAYPTGKRRLLQQGRHIDEMGDYEDYSLYGDDAAASTSDLDRPWLADLSSPSPTRRRLASSGLLSQTIHEEDSDDGSDAVL